MQKEEFSASEMMDVIGKKFLYRKFSDFNLQLNEFYDHQILKKKSEDIFSFNLSKREKEN
ncbi:hypothetical protein COBT_002831, partial [Conglomerata obtusa]